jgi:serine/threonine-protein kinase
MADIRDDALEGGLFEAFGPADQESVLASIQRLHGVGSSLLLRDADEGASPVLLRRDDDDASDPRFQVLGEIARGGIGVVYKGRDRDLNREVALKVLRKEFAERDDVVQRFIEEAQVGGQLQHPGIVPIYGLGLQADGRPSFAMKLIKGQTLAELLDSNPKGIDLLAVFEHVVLTMAYAHSRGVIHRDLKPANVMVGAFGEVQVVDWGFAKVLGHEEPGPRVQHTVIATVRTEEEGSGSIAGSVMGTPAYMPPEQALGRIDDLDERSDVFALGAILCEILTGQPPYTGAQNDQIIAASQCRLEPALERLDEAEAAHDLKEVVRACLQPLSADRPKSGQALGERIAEHFANVEERARQSEFDALDSEARAVREQAGRRRALIAACIALVAVLAGGGSYFAWDAERKAREQRAAPQIAAALREAKAREGDRDWTAALAAARRAADIAVSEGVDDAGAHAVLAHLERKRAASDEAARLHAADEQLLAALEAARARGAYHYDWEITDGAYVSAVRDRWPSMLVDTERLRASEHAEAFAAAFDAWVTARGSREGAGDPNAWARAIDPEHNRLRDSLRSEDGTALELLLEDYRVDALPTAQIATVGRALISAGKRDAAVALLRSAHRKHPGDFWINMYLGWVAGLLKDRELCQRHCLAALAIRPGSVEPHHWLGIAREETGDLDGALAEWREGLRKNPKWAHGLAHIGHVLKAQGKLNKAMAAYKASVRVAPQDPRGHTNLGILLNEDLKRYDDAAIALRTAIEHGPDNATAHNWLANTLSHLGNLPGAETHYRRAIQLDPQDGRNWSGLGDVQRRQGKLSEAVAACRKGVELAGDEAAAQNNLGLALAASEQWGEALAALERAMELDPNEPSIRAALGAAYFGSARRTRPPDQEHLEKAIAYLREAIERGATRWVNYFNLGNTLSWRGRPVEAAAVLRDGVTRYPQVAELRGLLGHTLFVSGELDQAVEQLEEAERLRPGRPDTLRSLAMALRDRGDADRAAEIRRQAIEIDPRLAYKFAWALMRKGWFGDAIVEFTRALDIEPKNRWVRYGLGTSLYRLGRYEEAILRLREAIEIDQEMALAWCNLAWCYRDMGRWAEALEPMRRGHTLGTALDNWSHPSARWLARTKRMAALEPRLQQAIEGASVEATPGDRALLAEMLRAKKRYALSVQLYREAFAADPSLAEHGRDHAVRAIWSAALAGEHAQALEWGRAWLDQVRKLDPKHASAELTELKKEPKLSSVRAVEGWKTFWADVDALLKREQAAVAR